MKNFYILDWSGYMYRAYHALPELTNSEWQNINAIYGFFRMMFKLLQNRPDNFVIAWDSPVKTIRHIEFKDYKANRPEISDNFKWQIWQIKALVKNVNVPFLEVPWYEADDIIHTIVERGKVKLENYLFTIVSSDKDLKQMLDDKCIFMDWMKSLIIKREDFIQENWFEPKYILDYLSLIGDASDNVPGVKWVGKKTAQDLVIKYGDLENMYANIDQIWWSVKEKLLADKEIVYKSKKLISLYDVPGLENYDINDFKINFNYDKFKDILVTQHGFKSMEKPLDELRKSYQAWQQFGLF